MGVRRLRVRGLIAGGTPKEKVSSERASEISTTDPAPRPGFPEQADARNGYLLLG